MSLTWLEQTQLVELERLQLEVLVHLQLELVLQPELHWLVPVQALEQERCSCHRHSLKKLLHRRHSCCMC